MALRGMAKHGEESEERNTLVRREQKVRKENGNSRGEEVSTRLMLFRDEGAKAQADLRICSGPWRQINCRVVCGEGGEEGMDYKSMSMQAMRTKPGCS